jgi:hypothetical protein
MSRFIANILLFVLIVCYPVYADTPANKNIKLITSATSLGKISPGIMHETILISPDSRRVAYSAMRLNGKIAVVLDGNMSDEYDDVDNFVFSSDSKKFAYAATSGGKWFAVVDGIKQKEYERLGSHTIRFSPDNKRICYMVWEPSKDRQFAVIDGIEQKPYVGIFVGHPLFSADSCDVAYGAKKGNKVVIVYNGKEGKPYDAAGGLVLSNQDGRFAYIGRLGKKWAVVIDGQEYKEKYDGFYSGCITFSPDARHFAYAAMRNDSGFVVLDGVEGNRFDAIDNNSLIFSPDSKHFAYRAIKGKKQFYVIDGNGTGYDGVASGSLVFSQDCNHSAYIAMQNKEHFVVLDGREGKRFSDISLPVFNPVSMKLAYGAEENGKWHIIGNEYKSSDYDDTDTPIFSPNGLHIAYLAKLADKQVVVTDSQQGNKYDAISQLSLAFTPDSRHIVYQARKIDKSFVIVDGVESDGYDIILPVGKFIFRSSDNINFIAVRDEEFFAANLRITEI